MPRRSPTFRSAANTAFSWVLLLFLIEGADQLLRHQRGLSLDGLGIMPRTQAGLIGILFSPLLHANWEHLLANALPLLVLLTLLFWDKRYRPLPALTSIWFLSGLGTWAIGRPGTLHVGASSIIFGLVAYLITAGIFLHSWRTAIIALLVLLAFGGIFYGVLPQDGPISWEGHLCGSVAGVAIAWINRRRT